MTRPDSRGSGTEVAIVFNSLQTIAVAPFRTAIPGAVAAPVLLKVICRRASDAGSLRSSVSHTRSTGSTRWRSRLTRFLSADPTAIQTGRRLSVARADRIVSAVVDVLPSVGSDEHHRCVPAQHLVVATPPSVVRAPASDSGYLPSSEAPTANGPVLRFTSSAESPARTSASASSGSARSGCLRRPRPSDRDAHRPSHELRVVARATRASPAAAPRSAWRRLSPAALPAHSRTSQLPSSARRRRAAIASSRVLRRRNARAASHPAPSPSSLPLPGEPERHAPATPVKGLRDSDSLRRGTLLARLVLFRHGMSPAIRARRGQIRPIAVRYRSPESDRASLAL